MVTNSNEQKPEVVPASGPNYDEYTKRGHEAAQKSHQRLLEIYKTMPHLNFDEIFSPYLQEQQDQPTMRAPGRMESFSRAFGSDVGNKTVLSQLEQAHQERRDKGEKILQTKRDILNLKMNQEIEGGKSQKALETLAEQKDLEWELDNIKSEREAREARDLETEKQKGRESLLAKKHNSAESLLRIKLRNKLEEMKLDPRIIMKIMDMEFQPLLTVLKGRINADPVLGENLTLEEQNEAVRVIDEAMPGIIKKGYVGGGATPPKQIIDATKPPQGPPKSRARMLYEQEQAKGK